MKSNKRFKGFTLIELIVVMAILAVLCGVLVPNGLAWIRDAKIKTCNSEAKTVFNTAVTVLQDYQLEGRVSEVVSSDGKDKYLRKYYEESSASYKYQIVEGSNVTDLNNTSASYKINNKLGSNFSDKCAWSVRIDVKNFDDKNANTIEVLSTIFADNYTGTYIGRYPRPANKKATGDFSSLVGDVNSYCDSPSDNTQVPTGFSSDPLTQQ